MSLRGPCFIGWNAESSIRPTRRRATPRRSFRNRFCSLAGIGNSSDSAGAGSTAEGKKEAAESQGERILVNVTADPSTAMLLRRARRVADHVQAFCIAVYVYSKEELSALPAEDRPTVDRRLRFAENLHIGTEVIHGNNRAQTLVDYARKKGATQLFLSRGAAPKRGWFPGLDFTDQVLQQASEMEVTVVAERSRQGRPASPYPEDEAGALMHAGYVRISQESTVDEAIGQSDNRPGRSK